MGEEATVHFRPEGAYVGDVIPFAREVLDLQPLAAEHWLLVVGLAFAYLLVVETDKALWRRRVARSQRA